MKIRAAAPSDTATIADFNLKLAWETEHLRLDPDTVTRGVTALIADISKGIYYVADGPSVSGQASGIIGQLCLTYEWSDWRNGNFWWIQSVFVREDSRGRGVFTALFEHVQKLARSQPEVCGLRLYMEHHNERARRAYHKLGMEQTHYQVFEKIVR